MSAVKPALELVDGRPAQDDYVIVSIVGDAADLSVVHRPAVERSWTSGWPGRVQTESFSKRMETSFAPPWWPSACGRVKRGSIYNRGGSIATAPLCVECEIVLRNPARVLPLSAAARDTLKLLEAGPVSIRGVASARGVTTQAAGACLLRLHARGLVVALGAGSYELVEDAVEAAA